MKTKHAKNDYRTRVNHDEPETAADFLNFCLKSTNPTEENIVSSENIE